MRPPIQFGAEVADHIDRLMSIEVPGMAASDGANGVVRGWSRPRLIPMTEILSGRRWAQVRTAVYAVCTYTGIVLYVGSVRRRSAALAPRMQRHFSEHPSRRSTWTHLALITLPDSLDSPAVLRCEGRVGRTLDPLDNLQLPAVPGRDPWIPRARQGC